MSKLWDDGIATDGEPWQITKAAGRKGLYRPTPGAVFAI